jgi:hypothetical protein
MFLVVCTNKMPAIIHQEDEHRLAVEEVKSFLRPEVNMVKQRPYRAIAKPE